MIKTISIENFQSHRKTELDLSNGVNVIVGVSDSGKSAIIRALKWLVFNRPLGAGFRSSWGGETTVVVETENGKFTHTRNDDGASYELNEDYLTAIGTDVPESVSNLLKLTDLNFQGQVDPHFLLSSTAGEAATQLNKAANLQLIDLGVKNLKSGASDLDRTKKAITSEIEGIELELIEFNYIDSCEKIIADLEVKNKQRGDIRSQVIILASMIDRIKQVELVCAENNWSALAYKLVLELNNQAINLQNLEKGINRLVELVDQVDELEETIGSLPDENIADDLIVLQTNFTKLHNGNAEARKLNSLIKSIKLCNETEQESTSIVNELTSQFNKLMPKTCPLCGSIVRP